MVDSPYVPFVNKHKGYQNHQHKKISLQITGDGGKKGTSRLERILITIEDDGGGFKFIQYLILFFY